MHEGLLQRKYTHFLLSIFVEPATNDVETGQIILAIIHNVVWYPFYVERPTGHPFMNMSWKSVSCSLCPFRALSSSPCEKMKVYNIWFFYHSLEIWEHWSCYKVYHYNCSTFENTNDWRSNKHNVEWSIEFTFSFCIIFVQSNLFKINICDEIVISRMAL